MIFIASRGLGSLRIHFVIEEGTGGASIRRTSSASLFFLSSSLHSASTKKTVDSNPHITGKWWKYSLSNDESGQLNHDVFVVVWLKRCKLTFMCNNNSIVWLTYLVDLNVVDIYSHTLCSNTSKQESDILLGKPKAFSFCLSNSLTSSSVIDFDLLADVALIALEIWSWKEFKNHILALNMTFAPVRWQTLRRPFVQTSWETLQNRKFFEPKVAWAGELDTWIGMTIEKGYLPKASKISRSSWINVRRFVLNCAGDNDMLSSEFLLDREIWLWTRSSCGN